MHDRPPRVSGLETDGRLGAVAEVDVDIFRVDLGFEGSRLGVFATALE